MIFPENVSEILKNITNNGFSAYAVGGCVRDTLLGKAPDDWDIASSALPEEIMNIFPDSVPSGISYGTVTVTFAGEKYEITTFRRDGEYLGGRKPENVTFVKSIYDDLARRDFTVNAIAAGLNGEIIDPFGGCTDLKNGVIRCVGDPQRRFSEDALRMLRGVRFAARLGFSIDPDTEAGIRKCAGGARLLSPERISEELIKIISSPRPEYVNILTEFGLLAHILPKACPDAERLALIADEENRLAAFAVLMELQGVSGEALTDTLRLPHTVRKKYRTAMNILSSPPSPLELIIRFGEETAQLMGDIYTALNKSEGKELAAYLSEHNYVSVKELKLDGDALKNLGFKGAEIGEALIYLAVSVSKGETANDPASLTALSQSLLHS